MIFFVTGEPGAGKSMWEVSSMIDDLVKDRAFVVTNEAMRLPQLRKYICARREALGIEEPFDLDENFKWLPSDDVFEFWRHRSGGLVLAGSPDREGDEETKRRRMPKEQFNEFMDTNFRRLLESPAFSRPVHYYISETADYFDSQEWQTTGRAVKWYARKHRHLHDNIYLTAHNADDVELRLRNLVSENIDLVNQTRRSIGPFKARPVIKAYHYFKMKAGGKTAFNSETISIDAAGVGSCYNTAGALGVHTTAEKNRNLGWLPHWALWVAGFGGVAAIALTFVLLPWLAGRASAKLLASAGNIDVVKTATAGSVKPVSPSQALGGTNASIARGTNSAPASIDRNSGLQVWVSGWVIRNGKINISLSDGRTITEESEVQRVERNRVIMRDGSVYWRGSPPGAGAKGAPVRQDTRVPAAVSANVPTGSRSEAEKHSVAAGDSTQIEPPPRKSNSVSSSWELDSGGVARLRPSADASHKIDSESSVGGWNTDADGVSRLRESVTLTSDVSSSRGPGLVH